MTRLIRYLREARAELGRVTWPTRTQVLEGTQTVLLFLVLFTALLFAMDYLLINIFQWSGVLPR
ncbi:MAG: preprotein translocase subunit SecE [Deinococcaceae bacterium]